MLKILSLCEFKIVFTEVRLVFDTDVLRAQAYPSQINMIASLSNSSLNIRPPQAGGYCIPPLSPLED